MADPAPSVRAASPFPSARMSTPPKILYTLTDEAPFLATQSLLPIVAAFTEHRRHRGRDARHLAGRAHPSQFPTARRGAPEVADDLAELGQLATTPEANIIKLPNISASVPQLKAAIKELQQQGYALPDYPEEPKDEREDDIKARYDRAKGSAVNPGAARRQLRPPRAAVGEAVRAQASAPHGRVGAGFEVARRAHGRRRFLRQRAVGD